MKKSMWKRIVALMLTLILSLEAAPLDALADTLDDISLENVSSVAQETEVTEETTKTAAVEEAKTYTAEAEEIVVASDTTASDFTYNIVDSASITITGYTGTEAELVVPDTIEDLPVTRIDNNAFYACASLKSIEIPDTVVDMGPGAFGACTALTSIDFPEGMTFVPESCFSGCTALTDVTLPETITTIYKEAFYGCTGLTELDLPDSITTIGYYAFKNCTGLTTVNYPLNWTKTLNLYGNEYNSADCGKPFEGCTSLTTITIPEGVTTIAPNAFSYSSITSLTLPSTLETIGNFAFYGTSSLTEITLPDSLTHLGDAAFQGCTGLTEIVIPESLTFIPQYGFSHCTGLTNVTFPETLTVIYREAFYGCTGLTELNLPDSITTIGYYAFKNCTGLTAVNYPLNWTKTLNLYGNEYNSADCGKPFEGCTSLTTITIPEGATTIAPNAFSYSSITSLTLPSTLETIGNFAFYGTSCLTEITLPDSLTHLGDAVFQGCTGLTEIEIPESLTFIPQYGFSHCTGLTNVTFPETLTVIYKEAFYGCTGLTELNLPDSITTMGYFAFKNCTGLTAVNYPLNWTKTLNLYGNEYNSADCGKPFEGCTSLATITIPEGVTTIAPNAFSYSSITEITLPSTLTTIRRYAFYGASSLTGISIPEGVTTMEHCVFQNCTGLTEVTLPESLTSLPASCFNSCTKLKSIVLPETMESVSNDVFYNCQNLKSLVVRNVKTAFGENALANCPNMTIYAPWYSFATIEGIKYGYTLASSDNEKSDLNNTVLVDANTNYTYDTSYMNIGGYINNTIEWEYTPDLTTKSLSIYIPSRTELDESTIYVNGELSTSYEWENQILTIKIPSKSGKVEFHTVPVAAGDVYGYAVVNYNYSGGSGSEIIDIVKDTINALTISAKEMTSSDTVTVNGIAPASASVELYVNDTLSSTVTASKAGKYSGSVTIENPVEGTRYIVKAKCVNGEEILEAQSRVTYQKDLPEVTGFHMYYNNHQDAVLDLLNVEKNHYTTYNPNIPFTFTVDMSQVEDVEAVYITTTRKNQKYYMETEYDAALGLFVGSGFFVNQLGKKVVPGTLCVEYNTKYEQPIATEEVEFDAYAQDNPIRSGTTVTTTEENGVTTYSMDMTQAFVQMGEDVGDVVLDFSIETVDEMAGTAIGDALSEAGQVGDMFSYFVPGLDDDRYIVTADYTDLNTYVMWVKDAGALTEQVTKYTIDLRTDGQYWSGIDDFAQDLSTFNTAVSVGSDIIGYRQDYYDLCTEIRQSTHIQDKAGAIKRADQLYGDQVAYTVLMTTLPLLVTTVAGVTGPVGIGFSLLCGMIGATSSFFWEYRTDQILGGEVSLRWAIDPSGYVYEGVTSNRIEGVTVYAYWKEELEDEEAILWNAEEFDQNNPLITDGEGRYSWDVPEGWWQVKCVKDGYETTYSEWLEVPPPQTEVNLKMVPTANPKVESVNVMEDKTEVLFDQYMDPETISQITLKDSNGNSIAYTLEYDTSETDLDGNVFAKQYTLVYNNTTLLQGKEITVVLPKTIVSADDKAIEAKTVEATCKGEMEVEVSETIILDNAEQHKIPIYIDNYDAQKNVTVTSDFESSLKITEVVMNADGTGYITVEKGLPGTVTLTITVEGSSISKEISVSVTREEHVHQYTTIVTKASTCKEAGTSADVCICGEVTNETTLELAAHSPHVDEAVSATCQKTGLTEGSHCSKCDTVLTPQKTVPVTAHTLITLAGKAATCTTAGLTDGARCTVCNTTVTTQKVISAKGHTTMKQTAIPASFGADGKTEGSYCSVCKKTLVSQNVIPKVTATLSKDTYTYNGKSQKPKVIVKDTSGKVLGTDYYTIKYSSGRKNVGKYTVTITLKNGYTGTTKLSFVINPKGTSLKSVKGASKSLKVTWKKQSKQITGYQIQYSTKKSFKSAKITTVKGTKKTSQTIKKLLKKKKYYVRIRTYKTVKGVKYYSSWSKSKNTKTK